VRKQDGPAVSTPWLAGVARQKLVDHWRRQAREERGLRALTDGVGEHEDPGDVRLDALRAAGGSATEPERHDYGWTSDCADDQGTHFYLGQH